MKNKFSITVVNKTVYIDRKDGETFNVQSFPTKHEAVAWCGELAKFLGITSFATNEPVFVGS